MPNPWTRPMHCPCQDQDEASASVRPWREPRPGAPMPAKRDGHVHQVGTPITAPVDHHWLPRCSKRVGESFHRRATVRSRHRTRTQDQCRRRARLGSKIACRACAGFNGGRHPCHGEGEAEPSEEYATETATMDNRDRAHACLLSAAAGERHRMHSRPSGVSQGSERREDRCDRAVHRCVPRSRSSLRRHRVHRDTQRACVLPAFRQEDVGSLC